MQFLNKMILSLYRSVALIALYAVLAGVVLYVGNLGFFAVSRTWIAPTSLSPTDTNSLGFTDKLVTSQNSIVALNLEIQQQQAQLDEFQSERANLLVLLPSFEKAICLKHAQNRQTGRALIDLNQTKQADNERLALLVAENSITGDRIEEDLAAGLITKAAAAEARINLNQARASLTDGKISSALLDETISDKTEAGVADVETLESKLDLQSKLSALATEIRVAQQQIAGERIEIARIQEATKVATDTPYFASASGQEQLNLAFVPYENEQVIAVGVPVYDCYFNFLWCRNVGVVRHLYSNEQRLQNPIFKTDMRGFLIELELADPKVVRSKVLFVGGKPLLI